MLARLINYLKQLLTAAGDPLAIAPADLPPAPPPAAAAAVAPATATPTRPGVALRDLLARDPHGAEIGRELFTMSMIGYNGRRLPADLKATFLAKVLAGSNHKFAVGGATRTVGEMKSDLLRDAVLLAGGIGSSTWGNYTGLHALPWDA